MKKLLTTQEKQQSYTCKICGKNYVHTYDDQKIIDTNLCANCYIEHVYFKCKLCGKTIQGFPDKFYNILCKKCSKTHIKCEGIDCDKIIEKPPYTPPLCATCAAWAEMAAIESHYEPPEGILVE